MKRVPEKKWGSKLGRGQKMELYRVMFGYVFKCPFVGCDGCPDLVEWDKTVPKGGAKFQIGSAVILDTPVKPAALWRGCRVGQRGRRQVYCGITVFLSFLILWLSAHGVGWHTLPLLGLIFVGLSVGSQFLNSLGL